MYYTCLLYTAPWSTVIGYSNIGWQDAATKWYRPCTFTTEWGSKPLASRNIPQWLLDTDIWIRAKGVNDTVRSAVNKAIDLYGKNTFVHWYFWHHYPYDTHYPDYFPPKAGFADLIADVRKREMCIRDRCNGVDIEALGTEFNVKAYPTDSLITTTLAKGKVKVYNNKESRCV